MKSMVKTIIWLSLLYSAFCEIRENRSKLCDMSSDNCEKFSFEQFQSNLTKTKVNVTNLKKINNNSEVVTTDAFANLIINEEHGKLIYVTQLVYVIGITAS